MFAQKPQTAARPSRPNASPKKDRESSVRHMLTLRAAGMLRRLHRAKLQDESLATGKSPKKDRTNTGGGGGGGGEDKKLVQKQQDLLVHEIDLFLAQKNSYNTTDKLIVPTDPELLAIAAKALARFDALKMPAPPNFDKTPVKQAAAALNSARHPTPQQPEASSQRSSEKQEEAMTLPILTSPRLSKTAQGIRFGKKIELEAYTSHVAPEYNALLIPKPPEAKKGPLPTSVDAQPGLAEKHPNGYYATPGGKGRFSKAEEEQALKELEDEEAAAMAKHKKGVKQKRRADLWAQLIHHENEKYIAEENHKKVEKKKQKQDLLEHLEDQIECKRRQQSEARENEQKFMARQEVIRRERENIQTQIEEARNRRHECEKVELMQQMREAELLSRKTELKAKLAEHQMKKAAEVEIQADSAQRYKKMMGRAEEALTAVAENEALKKIREENKRMERLKDQRQIEEFKKAMEKQEALRQEHIQKIKEKQTKQQKMSEALEMSLDERAKNDAARAAAQLEEINQKEGSREAKEKEERKQAKLQLKQALNDQIQERREQEERLRQEGLAEKRQVAEQAEQVRLANEEARIKRKDAIQQNKIEMVEQINEKQTRLQYQATRNMTDGERALNKRRLDSLVQSPMSQSGVSNPIQF